MKVLDLLNHIDSFAPFSLSEEWDNPGLMIGSYDAEVSKIAVCLDAVSEAVTLAHEHGCNVLLCHHPLIFRGVKKIDVDSEFGRTLSEALKRNVTIIAAHTNWDKAIGGVNDTLAMLLGLRETETLSDFGIFGIMLERMKPEEFFSHVKSSWNLSHMDIYTRNMPEYISRVSLCGGSGSSFWRDALNHDSDVYLTADMKYHELIDATREGLTIGNINHGEMERASLHELARKVSDCGIKPVILNINALNEPIRL
jgi:dinuclear metal center YbgI/SA1388 family protein